MPNILAHAGVQGILTRTGFRDADPKWIYLGCVIPDVPWILQRVVRMAVPSIDLYSLRAYVIVQASLLSCLLLCGAVALLARRFWEMGALLGLNALLHLLLDACKIKWASGVHLLAPFSWKLASWGFFWPESLISYGLTGGGLLYVIGYWRLSLKKGLGFGQLSASRVVGSVVLIGVYFVLPFLLLPGPEAADNHYIKTLGMSQNRTGHYVECDRAHYFSTPEGKSLECWNLEPMSVEGLTLHPPATVSVRGVFIAENKVHVLDSHVHHDWFRDNASYLGLALIAILWIGALAKQWFGRDFLGEHVRKALLN